MENFHCSRCLKLKSAFDFGTTRMKKRFQTCIYCRQWYAQQKQQPIPSVEFPVARKHDNDQIWQISNVIEFESVFTSLIYLLSAGNETDQEQLVTSTIQVTGIFPWEASSLQQYIALITEYNNAEQNVFQPIVNYFLTLSTTTLGFQYTLKQCKLIKDHGQCYYFVCNLSKSTKDHHKDHNNPARQRK